MPDDRGSVDIHVHSSASSDGDYAASAIIRRASDAGLRAIAFTDHETVTAVSEAIDVGRNAGVEVLPAVEITAFHSDAEIHLLGYAIDITSPGLLASLEAMRLAQEAHARQVVDALGGLGVDVEYDEARGKSWRPPPRGSMIVRAAILNGRNDHVEVLRPYTARGGRSQPYHEFFLDHMRPGGDAYVAPVLCLPAVEAIQMIRASGGVAVLAHPGGSLGPQERNRTIDELAGEGLAGVEVYSTYHSKDITRSLARHVSRRGLLATGGSDFHGPTIKPEIRFGAARYPYAIIESLKEHAARSANGQGRLTVASRAS